MESWKKRAELWANKKFGNKYIIYFTEDFAEITNKRDGEEIIFRYYKNGRITER